MPQRADAGAEPIGGGDGPEVGGAAEQPSWIVARRDEAGGHDGGRINRAQAACITAMLASLQRLSRSSPATLSLVSSLAQAAILPWWRAYWPTKQYLLRAVLKLLLWSVWPTRGC